MNGPKEKYYQWFIGLLLGLLLLVGGAVLDNMIQIGPLEDRVEAHIGLPAHPVTESQMDELRRRLNRMEDKQDAILRLLTDPDNHP